MVLELAMVLNTLQADSELLLVTARSDATGTESELHRGHQKEQ